MGYPRDDIMSDYAPPAPVQDPVLTELARSCGELRARLEHLEQERARWLSLAGQAADAHQFVLSAQARAGLLSGGLPPDWQAQILTLIEHGRWWDDEFLPKTEPGEVE